MISQVLMVEYMIETPSTQSRFELRFVYGHARITFSSLWNSTSRHSLGNSRFLNTKIIVYVSFMNFLRKRSHLHHPQTVRIDSKWSRLIWSSPHTSAYARFKRIYGHLRFYLGLQVMWVRLYLSSSPWKSIELRLSIYSLWSSSTCSKVK